MSTTQRRSNEKFWPSYEETPIEVQEYSLKSVTASTISVYAEISNPKQLQNQTLPVELWLRVLLFMSDPSQLAILNRSVAATVFGIFSGDNVPTSSTTFQAQYLIASNDFQFFYTWKHETISITTPEIKRTRRMSILPYFLQIAESNRGERSPQIISGFQTSNETSVAQILEIFSTDF
ncbi:hypothetical protein HK100_001112 [Physocladia obscura]|uniref:Uncharacterized protein n=1 Tax=Physocladia obscura TaxID=109957 RepID=A0AAD5XF32_9FUNG|nr:hypothetical protein HK100_001112 [Physocladia obscura]